MDVQFRLLSVAIAAGQYCMDVRYHLWVTSLSRGFMRNPHYLLAQFVQETEGKQLWEDPKCFAVAVLRAAVSLGGSEDALEHAEDIAQLAPKQFVSILAIA